MVDKTSNKIASRDEVASCPRPSLVARGGTGYTNDPHTFWLPHKMAEWLADPLWRVIHGLPWHEPDAEHEDAAPEPSPAEPSLPAPPPTPAACPAPTAPPPDTPPAPLVADNPPPADRAFQDAVLSWLRRPPGNSG